jgi:hypothetical protein
MIDPRDSRLPLDGDEADAFSRRTRCWIRWRRGEIARIKKSYSRRLRHRLRVALARDARNPGRGTE